MDVINHMSNDLCPLEYARLFKEFKNSGKLYFFFNVKFAANLKPLVQKNSNGSRSDFDFRPRSTGMQLG